MRIKLTKEQLFWHFVSVPFVLIIPIHGVFTMIKNHNTTGVIEYETFKLYSIPIAIALYFIQSRRLNFKKVIIQHNQTHFNNALNKTITILNCEVEVIKKDYARLHTKSNGGSWGEMITIFRNNTSVYINSICDPDKRPSIMSYGSNKKNIQTFINSLKEESYR